MRVSFVIPALNEAASIGWAIQRAWEAGAWEVIVADGGSSDDTARLASAARCQLVITAPGRAIQQNAGAQQAAGDVLLFQHADNWLAPGAASQIQQALKDPRVVAGAFWQQIEAPGKTYRLLEWGNAQRVRWCKSAYGDQGIFVRREVFEQIGRFPEVSLLDDVLLMKRLRRQGRLVLLPGPIHVSARRWQRQGIVRQTLRNWSILAAHRLGASPERLAKFYPRQR